ncbi:MAG: ribbon-helix-helix protein, CopG family [Pseudomonadota bacterium]
MVTTSLKLPDALKERVAKLADATGKTPHAFMVEAITEQALRIEEDREFMARALAAKHHFEETGAGYPAGEVNNYIREKLAGNNPPALAPKTYK